MPLPPDYHTHTPLCRHATGEPSELAAQALRVGLAEMGFSDHNPMPKDDFDDWRMRAADLDLYVAKVEKARRDHPRLIIKLALEVDFLPGYEDWVRDLAARHPWDYLIGSVHYLSPDWAIDNPTQLSEWKRRNALEVWTAYCEHLTKAAESGLFDIIGHADLCKKFAFYPQQESAPLFKAFIQAAKRHRVAIELNTQGVPRDIPQLGDPPIGRHRASADHVRLRRSCAGGGGLEPDRGGTARPKRRIHPFASFHQTQGAGSGLIILRTLNR